MKELDKSWEEKAVKFYKEHFLELSYIDGIIDFKEALLERLKVVTKEDNSVYISYDKILKIIDNLKAKEDGRK